MLNDDKTLFAIFGTPQQCVKLGPLKMEVGECVVGLSKEVKNLGVIFDQHLNFKPHIMAISKGAYFQLYNIQKIHRNLTNKAAQTTIHAFVNQRLDYANALRYGLPKCVIYNDQKVQNSAACTLTGAPCREHITPVLQDLHWLPVRCRVILRSTNKCSFNIFKKHQHIERVYNKCP